MEDMYLCNDIALPVNSNPGMAFPLEFLQYSSGNNDDKVNGSNNFVHNIADFISAILDYKELIDR